MANKSGEWSMTICRIPTDSICLLPIMNPNQRLLSYELLFKRHYSELVRHAYTMTGELASAEDIVQETFIAMVQQQVLERCLENVEGYLHRAVHNNTLYWLRQQKRRNAVHESAVLEQFALEWDAATDTEATQEKSLLLERISDTLSTLPPQQQAAFRLVYVEQRRYQEAADVLGVSLNTLKTNLKLAMRHMRRQLKFFAPWIHPIWTLLHYIIYYNG